jgi:hypothetical protein
MSDIEIFEHSGKGIPLLSLVIKFARKPITTIGGVPSVLKTEKNNIRVANVSYQSARK